MRRNAVQRRRPTRPQKPGGGSRLTPHIVGSSTADDSARPMGSKLSAGEVDPDPLSPGRPPSILRDGPGSPTRRSQRRPPPARWLAPSNAVNRIARRVAPCPVGFGTPRIQFDCSWDSHLYSSYWSWESQNSGAGAWTESWTSPRSCRL
jgi:hypothetical protein